MTQKQMSFNPVTPNQKYDKEFCSLSIHPVISKVMTTSNNPKASNFSATTVVNLKAAHEHDVAKLLFSFG